MKKILISILFFSFHLVLCADLQVQGQKVILDKEEWFQIFQSSFSLNWNHYLLIELDLAAGEKFNFMVECNENRYFDILILDRESLRNYKKMLETEQGVLNPILVRNCCQKWDFVFTPVEKKKYYLIIDNTHQPEGGHFFRRKLYPKITVLEKKWMTGRIMGVRRDDSIGELY
ncbi:MAG: hypothetical protein PHW04_13930 [Candidatus Wallbacteria bacterium]|nr:hypothetical protein [Candidatus Wallbacteria bacterium]